VPGKPANLEGEFPAVAKRALVKGTIEREPGGSEARLARIKVFSLTRLAEETNK
jgi:hypothetical protein